MGNDNNISVEITADGSATLLVKNLDEHYHSMKGAITEATHIYRDCAFKHRSDGNRLRLLEVGFGTGLNAVVTAMAADNHSPVHYISIEKYPVDATTLQALQYDTCVDGALLRAIHQAPWDTAVEITPFFTLEKRHADYLADTLPTHIDIVYFDAFAPEKQPEMWSREAFVRLYDTLNPQAVLTTYCAKGNIRRLLAEIGMKMERLAGPVNGKREILRATKL